MKNLIHLIILVSLISLQQGMFAQTFSGGESYGTEYDDYLYDFMVQDGKAYQLIKQKVLTYPETVYVSMLDGLDIRVNPLYLGNEYSSLKFTMDNNENIYMAGIYSQKVINDTSYLFVSKLDKNGKNIWSQLFEKKSDSVNVFIDESLYLYIYDNHFLYKLNNNGNLIWVKGHNGSIKYFNNSFYRIQARNIHDSFLFGLFCDSILFEKIDTSGDQVFQKVLNISSSTNTMISTNFSFNIINNRVFLSNSYWGKINVDPNESNTTFENTRTIYWGDKWGNMPIFNNYLAVYDTLGKLQLTNSKICYPRLDYACADSAGSLYFSGYIRSKTDFILNSDDSLLVTGTTSDKSFIAKYSNNLDFIWIRKFSGIIKYIGTSHYPVGGVEKLDVAGEFNGTINLDLNRPCDITFTSEKQDLFYAIYIYLNENISPTSISKQNKTDDFIFYPNPCNGIINIRVTDLINAKMEIFDLSGKLHYSNTFCNFSEINTIDISSLKNGYYLVKLSNKDKLITQKLLINK